MRAAQTVSLQEAEPAADLGPWTGASLYSGCYLVSRLVPAIFLSTVCGHLDQFP